MMRSRHALPIALLVLSACGVPAPAEQRPIVPVAPVVSAAPPLVTASSPTPVAPPAVPLPPLTARFHREIEAPVTAIALEHPPLAAALTADAAWIHDAHGWHTERLPSSARGTLSVFYGRDDRIRVVGSRPEGAVYLRWLPAGFRAAGAEIGKLADLRGTLVAVLGTADPEIVCRPGDICYVKRRSGWTTIAAPADLTRVALGDGVGWAVAGQQLLRLGSRWDKAGSAGAWTTADMLFATRDHAWIVETAEGRIHTFDGAGWRVTPSPIDRPRALWGAREDALWLAGDGGLAFFDGHVWRRVEGAPAPLAAVAGRGADDVWIGGQHGLFRVERGEGR